VLLQTGHFHAKDGLRLGRELLDDIFLETTKHEGLELAVEGLDLCLLLSVTKLKVVGELELLGLNKVEQRKEFLDRVLQRSASDQQTEAGREALESLVQLRVAVLETVRLVNLQSLPFDLLEILAVLENELVRGEKDVEAKILGRAKLGLTDHVTRGGGAHVDDNVEIRSPGAELHCPGVDRRQGNDNEEGAVLLLSVEQVRKEADRLDSLAETHLVGEHATVATLAPEVCEPVESSKLEGLEGASTLEVLGVLGNLLVSRSTVDGVVVGTGGNCGTSHACVVRLNSVLGLVLDVVVGLPGALGVLQVGPLAEEQGNRTAITLLLLLAHYALHKLVALQELLVALAVNLVLLEVFACRLPLGIRRGVVVCLLQLPHFLNVVFDLLEAGELLVVFVFVGGMVTHPL